MNGYLQWYYHRIIRRDINLPYYLISKGRKFYVKREYYIF